MTAPEQIEDAELVEPEGAPTPTTADLVPVGVPITPIVRPIADVNMVRAAFAEYEQIKAAVVVAADKMTIQGRTFITKSGWRKLAVVMGVSGELVAKDYDRDSYGRIIRAEVIVRAIAPNGRTMDGLGVCDYRERCCPKAYDTNAVCKNNAQRHSHCPEGCDGFNHFSKPQHDIPATAFTRSLNRACSDLFGFGEVSAEEVTDRDEPAEDVDKARILAGLNAIDDTTQRRGAKSAFARQFGNPDELLKGQVANAIKFVTANGGAVPDEAPDPAVSAPPATTEPLPAPTAPATAVATDTSQASNPGESPGAVESSGSETGGEGQGGRIGSDASAPPVDNENTPPGDDPSSVDPAGATPPPAPNPEAQQAQGPGAAPFVPSTGKQRQRLGMLTTELKNRSLIIDADKAEIVSILTGDRTTTTTEMSEEEARTMIAVYAYIGNGDLAMDTTADGRVLISKTEKGREFIQPIVEAIDAQFDAAVQSPVY